MELLQLHYFVTVARLEHVTEAALHLHVTQSSLSKTIQRLEDNLGVPLFDRTGRNLRLNDYGRRFLRRAEKALSEIEEGKRELRDLTEQEHSTLRLAVTTASKLPAILRRFQAKLPHVQFHVEMLTMEEMSLRLHRGEVDYGLTSPPIVGEDIDCQIVYVDPILVALPEEHRLADREYVSLIDLKEERFVGVKRGYGTRDLVDSTCHSAGFVPQYVYEGDEPARLSALVEAGIGIAFLPSTARNPKERIRYVAVEDCELQREIALLQAKSRYISRAAQEFRLVVVEYFETLSQS